MGVSSPGRSRLREASLRVPAGAGWTGCKNQTLDECKVSVCQGWAGLRAEGLAGGAAAGRVDTKAGPNRPLPAGQTPQSLGLYLLPPPLSWTE